MKKAPFTPFLLLAIATLPLTLCAQQPIENKLLWRISGNGLTKPSWLYGTIHLMDKQVFNFGDSVYAALEACEGYAMEIAPDAIVASLIRETRESKTLKTTISAKTFERLKKKLQEKFDREPDEVTVKEFKDYFTNSVNKPGKNGMNTIMDTWFYDAVRRQGKWVGGIEDVEDQRSVGDNLSLSFYINDFLNDHRSSKKMLDQMIRIYKEEDLEGIETIEQVRGGYTIDSIMLRRNRKMAYRMDSLARIRSTFFAVGSAHLPGDSGVISFLRRKGFTVQPITSSKYIPAETWHFPVKEIPWTTVSAANGQYTVQMPAEPQQMALNDESADMKMYADIASNQFFIVMSVEKGDHFNIDTLMAETVKNVTRKAHITETRSIVKDSVQGKEILAKNAEATYRIHFYYKPPVFYMLMAGSTTDTMVYSKDSERFLKSLVMHKKAKSNYVPWSDYTSDRHAFKIKFPGKPTAEQDKEDEENIITYTYSSLDLRNDVYFQCMVQDMKKGYYLTGDARVFDSYRNYLAGTETFHSPRHRFDTIQQYPAMWSEFMRKEDNGNFYNKVLSLHRGNRIYHLFATATDSVKSREAVNKYFSSFSFIPVKETGWKMEPGPDNSFAVWSPGQVTEYQDTANRFEKAMLYEIYDAVTPCTYNLRKAGYSPYFWIDSDTTLLRQAIDGWVSYGDTLLSKKYVTNGEHHGVEILVGLEGNHNVRKVRMLIAGDSLFTLYGITAPEYMTLDNSRRLFEDFKINHTGPTNLFTDKAASLLKALASTDTVQFLAAKEALHMVHFAKKDLPLLHKAMAGNYRDSGEYNNSTNTLLLNAIAGLRDESTLPAVEEVWNRLPASQEKQRYELLDMIAGQQTAASVALVKKLLLSHPPQEGEPYRLFYKLSDSLELMAPVFPELLPLLKDSLAGPQIVSLAEDLLDSSLVDVKVVLAHKESLYTMAAAAIKYLKRDDDSAWVFNYHTLARLLAKLKEPVANQWVRKFLLQPNMYLKQTAAMALLKAGQPVDPAELLKLAADKEQRIMLYTALKEIKKTALFPKQYLTQQALAESNLYTYASDDNEVRKMTFIGERTLMYKGVHKKFYLYKVDMSYEDEKVIHLGIAGPYELKPGAIVAEASATGINWEKEYNADTIEADLKEYLKKMEQYDEQ